MSSDRIREVLDTETSVHLPATPVRDLDSPAPVTFDAAGFTYPGADRPVLSDITFTARPGATTAIIGSTGAGETTLVSMVPRLFDATDGRILVDATDVRHADPDTLWSRIGLVPQRPYLFTGTVASNLRYGDPHASDDDLWAALEVAQAAAFVRAMPDGLDAPISQGGANVSWRPAPAVAGRARRWITIVETSSGQVKLLTGGDSPRAEAAATSPTRRGMQADADPVQVRGRR